MWPGLYAMCPSCKEVVGDWRKLLGVGASVVAGAADADRFVLRHPGACSNCGASELTVIAAGDAEKVARNQGCALLLGRFVEDSDDGEKRIISTPGGLAISP
jgi:hypothetical protein